MEPRNGKHYKLAEGLCGLLADTYVLYNTTQVAHWNADGPDFNELHGMLERQYRELASAVDLIAERMHDLGIYAPGTLLDYVRFSHLHQTTERGLQRILKQLVDGHQAVGKRIRSVIEITREADDGVTMDLLSRRLRAHQQVGSELLLRVTERMQPQLSESSHQRTLPLGRGDQQQRVTA